MKVINPRIDMNIIVRYAREYGRHDASFQSVSLRLAETGYANGLKRSNDDNPVYQIDILKLIYLSTA